MVEMIAQYSNTYLHTSMMEKMYTELFYDIVTSLFPYFLPFYLIKVPRHNSHYFKSKYYIITITTTNL